MNKLQIFKNEEFGEIRNIRIVDDNPYLGFFYALEYGDFVKIGSTKNPYERLRALRKNAEYNSLSIGRIAISPAHTNYRENEKELHKLFGNSRNGNTELFKISLDDFISRYSDSIKYKDESEELEKESETFFNELRNFVLGGI